MDARRVGSDSQGNEDLSRQMPSWVCDIPFEKRRAGRGAKRELNNAVVEIAMRAAGVRVVRTLGLAQADYLALTDSAESLFADHGSAIYNMMFWQTRRVVELFSPEYWDASFLCFAAALGINDYHVWQINAATSAESVQRRIDSLMTQPPSAT